MECIYLCVQLMYVEVYIFVYLCRCAYAKQNRQMMDRLLKHKLAYAQRRTQQVCERILDKQVGTWSMHVLVCRHVATPARKNVQSRYVHVYACRDSTVAILLGVC